MDNEYTPHLENVKIIKLLYKTKLSKIWLVRFENENSDFYILKGKHIKSLSQYDIDSFKRERKFVESNKCEFFPKFIKAFKDNEYVYLLLNFFEGLPLSDVIRENIILLNEYDITNQQDFMEKKEIYTFIVYQLALIVEHLYNNNYIHRDLKLNNIIINKNLKINLIDFGFWKELGSKDGRASTLCGTFHSMAPELFLVNNIQYGIEIDVYSYGVILYEYFTRNSPFPYFFNDDDEVEEITKNSLNNSNENLDKPLENNRNNSMNKDPVFEFKEKTRKYYFKYGKNVDLKITDNQKESFYKLKNITGVKESFNENLNSQIKNYTDNIKNLIEKCLKFNPSERIKADEIIYHDLFKDFDYNKTLNRFSDRNYFENIINSGKISALSEFYDLIRYNGEFKEEYALNSQFEDIFDKYF